MLSPEPFVKTVAGIIVEGVVEPCSVVVEQWLLLPVSEQCILMGNDHIGMSIQYTSNYAVTTPGIADEKHKALYRVNNVFW